MIRPRAVAPFIEQFPVRTPTLAPATHTNSYALGNREVLLVEPATPYADEQRAWLEWARGLQSQGRKAIAIFVTHDHADHVGGIEVLSRELNLPIWLHEYTKANTPKFAAENVRLLRDGDEIVLDGQTRERWEVLHTPGHAVGHLCLWNSDSNAVVVGDMVASLGTILINPGDGDMQVYLQQLERLAKLGAAIALPAHGEPIAEPEVLFRHYIAHRKMREEKIVRALSLHGEKGATLDVLLPDAYDDTPMTSWPFALLSLQAHLIKLVRENRARMRGNEYVAS